MNTQYNGDNVGCCGPCDPWGSSSSNRSVQKQGVFDDADIAKEMNQLTFEEREKVLDDVHGVAKVQEETPEFVKKCIQELDQAISEIPTRQCKDYNRALFLWPQLKQDDKVKLMFLRSTHYNAKKAALRMMQYIGQKRILFGEDKLVKRITTTDLNQEDLLCLQTFMTEFPMRDQTGRPILLHDCASYDANRMSVDSVVRAFWYHIMSAVLDDETAQLRGVCTIANYNGANFLAQGWLRGASEFSSRCGYLVKSCLPLRITSIHLCYDDPRMEVLMSTIRLAIGSFVRLRLRTHYGSDVENEYSLMTFGVNCEGLLQAACNKDTSVNNQYVRRRRAQDEKHDKEETQMGIKLGFVPYPSSSDVLIGRGRPYRDFPGNMPWHQFIETHLHRYRDSTTQFEKTCVTMDVTKLIRQCKNIRFLLEPAPGGWKVMDDNRVRAKVAAAFQNRLKALSRNESLETKNGKAAKRQKRETNMENELTCVESEPVMTDDEWEPVFVKLMED